MFNNVNTYFEKIFGAPRNVLGAPFELTSKKISSAMARPRSLFGRWLSAMCAGFMIMFVVSYEQFE